MSDLKTLANSLTVKLRGQKERWVDKAVPAQGEHSKDGSRKHASGPKSGLTPAGGTSSSQVDGDRVVTVDSAPGGERRSDSGTVIVKDGKDGKEGREHKEHKDGKEGKEGKSKERDRGEAKAR